MTLAILLALLLVAAPQSADEPLARADYLRLMDQEFAAYDADRDGVVTSAEVAAKLQQDLQMQALQANRQLFAQLDTNQDGMLSLQEFAALAATGQRADPSQFMGRVDLDGDGNVTQVEHRRVMLGAFDAIDTNLDGIVTAAELAASQQGGAAR